MINQQQMKVNLYLQEYDKLKAEQTARIGFRDNLLYVTLTLFGAIVSYAISKESYLVLIVVPWVCLIMGWTYLVNDEKISAIGCYIRLALTNKLAEELGITNKIEIDALFGWEIAHRDDNRRKRRKIEQLIIDEITFGVAGISALVGFCLFSTTSSSILTVLFWSELGLLIILGIEIAVYADLKKGADDDHLVQPHR